VRLPPPDENHAHKGKVLNFETYNQNKRNTLMQMLSQIIEDIKIVLQWLRNWQSCHTKRAKNYAANGLAKIATLQVIYRV
jgi:hypothetical protein